jgi:hypothetical protein
VQRERIVKKVPGVQISRQGNRRVLQFFEPRKKKISYERTDLPTYGCGEGACAPSGIREHKFSLLFVVEKRIHHATKEKGHAITQSRG